MFNPQVVKLYCMEDTGACGVCEVTGEWRSASSKTTTWTEISQYNTVATVQTRAYHLLALGNPVEVIGGGYGETLPRRRTLPNQPRLKRQVTRPSTKRNGRVVLGYVGPR